MYNSQRRGEIFQRPAALNNNNLWASGTMGARVIQKLFKLRHRGWGRVRNSSSSRSFINYSNPQNRCIKTGKNRCRRLQSMQRADLASGAGCWSILHSFFSLLLYKTIFKRPLFPLSLLLQPLRQISQCQSLHDKARECNRPGLLSA
jgi:hypothetical protein